MKISGMSRRRFFGGVSIAGASLFGYAHYFEAERIETNHVSVPVLGGGRSPFKLLHLSDLHASGVVPLSYIDSALQLALSFQPDVICLTGDFITTQFDAAQDYSKVLRRLSSAAPTFAIAGNHDGGRWALENGGHPDLSWLSQVLSDAGVRFLQNEAAPVAIRDWKVNIVGVGDGWAGLLDPVAAFGSIKQEGVNILLSHNPDTKADVAAHPWQLMLSGHTHGGQLDLPLIGTPFAPVRDKRFVAGLRRWNDRWVHVTKGIGNLYGMRINCRPEASFLTLT